MTSHDPEDIVTEFYIDGAWTDTYAGEDLAARVRGGDSIILSAGGSDQFSPITSRSSSFTLNNQDNLFTDDDPNSPLFRKFGQNTRVRHSLLHPTRNYDLYAKVMDQPLEPNGTRIYTADKASLDITGDIDVRWEMDMRETRNKAQFVTGKFLLAGSQLSWMVFVNAEGKIGFLHTTSGGAGTLVSKLSTVAIVPEVEQRLAYRVTLDVDNGAAGRTYTWYTSDSIDGTWTQVDTSTSAGTTSIFSGTGSLTISAGGNGDIVVADVYPFRGRVYGVQVRNGIAGTLVADFNPNDDAALGDTTWVDGCASPNTWIIENAGQDDGLAAIRLASDRVRFTGEIQTRPDDWDKTGTDRWCAMGAQGTLARYQGSSAALGSTEWRYWTRADGVVGYWPCEDGNDATIASSAIDQGRSGVLVGCSFTNADGYPGSSGSLVIDTAGTSSALMRANTHTATGAFSVVFGFNVNEIPVSNAVIANIYPKNSNVHRWVININATAFDFQAYSHSGTILGSASSLYGSGVNPTGDGWVVLSMTFKQDGSNIRWETLWHQVGSSVTYSHLGGGSTFAGTVGTINYVLFNPSATELDGMRISQVKLLDYEYELGADTTYEVTRGFRGETFGRRWVRLLAEEGIGADWVGDLDLTEECGPQQNDTLYNVLESGAKLDGGLITEARDMPLTWTFVSGAALGNRKRLQLSYSNSEIVEVPRPAGDGRYTLNDFTASRIDGASARYEATDNRRKNVREPDDASPGVGRVQRSDSYNANDDDRMWYLASFRVHLGTWDERVIPKMVVQNARDQISGNASLHDRIISQNIGDPIAIVDTAGTPLPPNDAKSVVTGYVETISNLLHDIEFSTVPRGPYETPILTSYLADYDPRLDVEGDESVLKSSLTSSATSFVVKTLATATVPFWVDAVGYPNDIGGGNTLDIDIGGERITISSITAPSLSGGYNEQTFTVSARSVNSVVKAHDALSVVKLFDPSYLGRI